MHHTKKKYHTKAKAQTAKLKDRAGIVGACMLPAAECLKSENLTNLF